MLSLQRSLIFLLFCFFYASKGKGLIHGPSVMNCSKFYSELRGGRGCFDWKQFHAGLCKDSEVGVAPIHFFSFSFFHSTFLMVPMLRGKHLVAVTVVQKVTASNPCTGLSEWSLQVPSGLCASFLVLWSMGCWTCCSRPFSTHPNGARTRSALMAVSRISFEMAYLLCAALCHRFCSKPTFNHLSGLKTWVKRTFPNLSYNKAEVIWCKI